MIDLAIAKDKNIWPDYDVVSKAKEKASSVYNFLAERHLINFNSNRFIDDIKDFYRMYQDEYMERTNEIVIPSVEDIADMIDEENLNIISLFVQDINTEKDDNELIDDVIVLYTNYVTCSLPFKVEEALNIIGFPYSKDKNIYNGKSAYYYPGQLRLFMEGL